MSKFDALFEDENDIFVGTPKSKYWDIARQMSQDTAEIHMDELIERIAVMERMLMEHHHEEELNDKIKQFSFHNSVVIEDHKKSLYMEFAGELLFKVAD